MTGRRDTMPAGLWVQLMCDEDTPAPYPPQELFRCRRCAGLKPLTWRAPVASVVTGVRVTDEAMAMERLALRPLLVEGAEDNLKVTTPADLAYFEFLLERRTR